MRYLSREVIGATESRVINSGMTEQYWYARTLTLLIRYEVCQPLLPLLRPHYLNIAGMCKLSGPMENIIVSGVITHMYTDGCVYMWHIQKVNLKM
jgi:hypothetical protein